jgi:hypothetical protein
MPEQKDEEIQLPQRFGEGQIHEEWTPVHKAVFNGMVVDYAALYGFVEELGKTIGKEKAWDAFAKYSERLGSEETDRLRETHGVSGDDAHAARRLWDAAIEVENAGMQYEVVSETDDKLVLKIGSCFVYNAAKKAGLEPHEVCPFAGPRLANAMFKRLDERLGERIVKYRTHANDYCVAEIGRDVVFGVTKPANAGR